MKKRYYIAAGILFYGLGIYYLNNKDKFQCIDTPQKLDTSSLIEEVISEDNYLREYNQKNLEDRLPWMKTEKATQIDSF